MPDFNRIGTDNTDTTKWLTPEIKVVPTPIPVATETLPDQPLSFEDALQIGLRRWQEAWKTLAER